MALIARLGRNLTFRVLVAIALGVLLGVLVPDTAKAMKPLGDTFVNLVRMIIAPIIFLTIVLGVAHTSLGRAGRPVTRMLDRLGQVFFRIVGLVMIVAPIGAFGAMAYTVGNFGVQTLVTLGRLMACVYATMAVFIFGVLN